MKQIIQNLVAAVTGFLSNLTTTDKSSLVAAINEVNAKPGGGGGGSLPSGDDGEFLGRDSGSPLFKNILTADVKDAVPTMITDVTLKSFLEEVINWDGINIDTSSLAPNSGTEGQMHFKELIPASSSVLQSFLFYCVGVNKWVRQLIKTIPYYGVPNSLLGLVTWLDASDTSVATSGGAIIDWVDKSGRIGGLSVVGSPTITTAYLNGKNVALFSGTDGLLFTTGMDILRKVPGVTIYAVVKYNSSVVGGNVIQVSNPIGSGRLQFSGGVLANKYRIGARRLDNDTYAFVDSSNNISSGFAIQSAIIDFSATKATLYIDNVKAGENLAFQTSGLTSDTASQSPLYVGIGPGNTNLLNGYIAELIVYNRALLPDENTTIVNYLNTKWGL